MNGKKRKQKNVKKTQKNRIAPKNSYNSMNGKKRKQKKREKNTKKPNCSQKLL